MEVKRKGASAQHANSTRVYSRGSLAYAYQPATAPKREAERAPQNRPVEKARPALKPRTALKPRLSAGCKAALFIAILPLCASFCLLLFRYNQITEQYGEVNRLSAGIAEAQQRVKSLNVALECAVSIQEVQNTAQAWGMTYPNADQYVRAGEPVPAYGNNMDTADPVIAGEGGSQELPGE